MSKRCFVVGVELKGQNDQEKLSECIILCEASDYEVLGTMIQRSQSRDPRMIFRTGKVQELKQLVQSYEVQTVVFYHETSVSSAQRLSEELGCEVVDRNSIILDIFSTRARTKQAKIQTELARLSYALPRELAKENEATEHQKGGGVISRGSGEQRSEIIARKYAHRKQVLQEELKRIEKQRQQDERRRAKTLFPRVGLVGYTNAGKSSLLNGLLEFTNQVGKPVQVKDRVFETLDTSVRLVEYKGFSFYLYDTVGFVSDLPKTLVDAFYSTLESAKQADVLIHVVDGSDPSWEQKLEDTQSVLTQIQAHPKETLLVFSKKDLHTGIKNGLWISSKTKEGYPELLNQVLEFLFPKSVQFTCLLPYDKMALFNQFNRVAHMEIMSEQEEGLLVKVAGQSDIVKPLRPYQIKERNNNQ